MFCKFADNASFEQSAITRGLSERKCAFADIVTVVSVIPLAILAKVLPVQGAIIKASRLIFGPSGSASTIEFMTLLPVIFSTFKIKSLFVPKRVDVLYTF